MFQALCVAAALASATPQARVEAVVDAAVAPVMKKDGIPGMAVGAASTRPKRPVTRNTLFELGSVSKVFTATLASYAAVSGDLSLSANVDRYYPSLRGTAFGRLTLLNLGTHTTGGLPLQAPDGIETIDQLMA
jgi:beta-lactamase class C